MLSIIIPHKNTPQNNEALELAKRSIRENTRCKYELMIITDPPGCPGQDPYNLWNVHVPKAQYENIIFSNSDVVFGPGWDTCFVKYAGDNRILTQFLVEPGFIGVSLHNIKQDWGVRPSNFQYTTFCNWVRTVTPQVPEIEEKMGHHMPSLVLKSFFLRMGGFQCAKPFPHSNDQTFFNTCRSHGAKIYKVRSFAYHFQQLSRTPR
ncbi:MAG: glycosyltransferase family A protein [Candidatus Nanopelagicaceae bacterium]|nr:glycosyltransferase family A protein [Candidatus Nanopelagicaceae bacterium]